MIQQLFDKAGLRQRLQRSYLGIEITDYCIKLVEIEPQQKGLPVIKRCIMEPIDNDAVVNGIIADSVSLIRSIKQLLADHKVKSRNVHFALPTHLVLIRFLKFPDIAQQDLRKMIQFEIEHNLQLPFEQPCHDFVKLNGTYQQAKPSDLLRKEISVKDLFSRKKGQRPIPLPSSSELSTDEEQNMCDVLLAAAPSERVQEYVEVLEAAGLQLISFEVKPLSLFRLMTQVYMANKDQTILVADIGRNNVDLLIIHQGELKISRSISLRFLTTANKGLFSKEREMLDEICIELADEIDRLIKFYMYTLDHREHELSSIYLCGDIDQLEEIKDYLNDQMQQDVFLLPNPAVIETMYPDLDSDFPAFAAPLGMAIRGKEA